MDKLIRNIIITVVVVLLLLTTYFVFEYFSGMVTDKQIEENAAQSEKITVMSLSIDYVKSVTVTNDSGTYTLERNAENVWGIKEYPNMNTDELSIETAVLSFINIYALKEVDMPQELSEYGFDNPRAQFTVNLLDGTQRTFALGSTVTGDAGDFLHDVTNNKAYTTTTTSNTMLKKVESFRKTKLASVSSNDIMSLSITNKNGKMVMGMKESDYSSELVLAMTYPRNMDLDETMATAILENISDINVIEYVEDNAKNLSKYGLSSPDLVIEYSTATANYKLLFGDRTDSSTVYAMLEGTNFVFTHSPVLYEQCVNLTAYDLMNKFVNAVYITDVKSITVSDSSVSHKLEISGSTFQIDGKTADNDTFREVYRNVIGIKVSGLTEKQITSPVEYTVVFEYNNGESSTIKYASYDDMNYYVDVDGEITFTTLKKGLSDMMTAVKNLAANTN